MTGEEKYACRVAEVLAAYAKLYPTLGFPSYDSFEDSGPHFLADAQRKRVVSTRRDGL